MNELIIEKAKLRLEIAEAAVARLDGEAEFRRFWKAWDEFLRNWAAIYNVFEAGLKKESPQTRQWFNGKKHERKKDHLLQYLFQARHDEEHGLIPSVEPIAGAQLYAIPDVGGEGREIRMEINSATGSFHAVRPDGGPLQLLQEHPAGFALKSVTNAQFSVVQVYAHPIDHLGELIDMSPKSVAALAIAYMKKLIAEAESLP